MSTETVRFIRDGLIPGPFHRLYLPFWGVEGREGVKYHLGVNRRKTTKNNSNNNNNNKQTKKNNNKKQTNINWLKFRPFYRSSQGPHLIKGRSHCPHFSFGHSSPGLLRPPLPPAPPPHPSPTVLSPSFPFVSDTRYLPLPISVLLATYAFNFPWQPGFKAILHETGTLQRSLAKLDDKFVMSFSTPRFPFMLDLIILKVTDKAC